MSAELVFHYVRLFGLALATFLAAYLCFTNDSLRKIGFVIVPLMALGLFLSVEGFALEVGVTYENIDITSSVAYDTVSDDDNFHGTDTASPRESGGDISNDDFNYDSDALFIPNPNGILTDTGDDYVPEPPSHPNRNIVLDSGITSTTVNEDIHALREYSEFFLFGFVPITIAVLLLALGCNWFYKTFVSSIFF